MHMENAKKIIVADDEARIRDLIADFLSANGYEALKCSDGDVAVRMFRQNPDTALVILDIMMPEMDGWQACREIRKLSERVPIIMLTARAEEFDQLMGFEAGTDEYVTKPFSPAVLIKRIDVLIRRSTAVPVRGGEKGLRIDSDAYLAYLDGKPLELTLKEFEILRHLYENAGRVLTRDQLLNAIWGYDFMGELRTVDSHMAHLRTKLGDYGNSHLKTIYGLGYKIEV